MIDQRVTASRISRAFLGQSDLGGLALYKALASIARRSARDFRHYLFINGSPGFRAREPAVVGTIRGPATICIGRLTRAAIDAYVRRMPDAKATITTRPPWCTKRR